MEEKVRELNNVQAQFNSSQHELN